MPDSKSPTMAWNSNYDRDRHNDFTADVCIGRRTPSPQLGKIAPISQ
jgi:hypothetical protein